MKLRSSAFISDGKHTAFFALPVILRRPTPSGECRIRDAKIRCRDKRLAILAAKKPRRITLNSDEQKRRLTMNFLLCTPNGIFTAGIILGGIIGFVLGKLIPGLQNNYFRRQVAIVAGAAAGAVLAGILSTYFPLAC
jgi:hypothetical protein